MSALQLEAAATVLGPLIDEVVFVGGATVHVWLTEPGAPPVRATDDVDVICEVATLAEYYRLGSRLRERGLREAVDEPVICRWRSREPQLVLDVMPTDPDILGFSNPWYGHAIDTAERVTLGSGTEIRVARPVALIATKLSAWKGRGNGDLLRSLDVHDILTLIDGRPEVMSELREVPPELRTYVEGELAKLTLEPYFGYLLQSATASYGRVGVERARLLNERLDQLIGREGTETGETLDR